jgi:hypothetical protein
VHGKVAIRPDENNGFFSPRARIPRKTPLFAATAPLLGEFVF